MPLPSATFNAAKSIYAGRSIVQLKVSPALSGVTAATTVITTAAAHGLSLGQQVQFVSGTGFTGLTAGTAYYVVLVGSATTFSVSATSGGSAIAVGTSSTGVFQPVVVFESRLLNSKLEQETKEILRPDSTGVLRKVRIQRTKAIESFQFEMDEAKRLLDIFGGALSGFAVATCTLWLPDPTDAIGECALVSEADFPCTIIRDGDAKFGDGDFTKASINIESTKSGAITWTADATVT